MPYPNHRHSVHLLAQCHRPPVSRTASERAIRRIGRLVARGAPEQRRARLGLASWCRSTPGQLQASQVLGLLPIDDEASALVEFIEGDDLDLLLAPAIELEAGHPTTFSEAC